MCLVCAQPWLSSHTWSTRWSAYGMHPIWLSAYMSCSAGWRTRTPDIRKSINDDIALPNARVALTDGGASGDAAGIFDDDPMCIATTVRVSAHAAKKGSQYPVWIVGRPRWYGSSLKHTACTPRAALRCTSAAASSASHNGMIT